MRNFERGQAGAVRHLWQEADSLRDRISAAHSMFAFFSFESALSQRASHGHLRTLPAARPALIRLCAAPNTRGAVLSARPVATLQRRMRLHRLAYVGVHGADVQSFGLRLVSEPDRERAETSVQKMRRACSRDPVMRAAGLVLEDRTWTLVLHFKTALPSEQIAAADAFTLLATSEGMQIRRGRDSLEACAAGPGLGGAALGLLAGLRRALSIYVGAGEADEEGFAAINGAGGLSVYVGEPPRAGTQARWQVADSGEVIRLIHWLADARRRP